MSYELTHQEKAFIKAFRLCFGSAEMYQLEYYFEYRELAQLASNKEQQLITEGIDNWSNIEDAWLLWREAIEYANKPPLKKYKVIATYSAESEVYIEAESEEQAYALAKECGGFDGTIDHDDWQIEKVEEVTK